MSKTSHSKQSNLKLNFIYNVGYQILVIFLPLITTPYISRVLGPEKLGVYSYTHSVANYFLLFVMLGVANYGNRCIAQVREDKDKLSHTFWSIYKFQLLRSVAVLIAYIAYIVLFERDYLPIALLQSIYVFSGMLDISWFFFGMEQFKITILRNAIIRIANLCLIFVFVKNVNDLWKYTLIMTVGVVFSQGYLWYYLPRFVTRVRVEMRDLVPHIKPELILFVPVIAVSLYKIMDKVMLGMMSTMAQGGYYQNAEKIINIPLSIITALGTVMLPRMSNLASKGDSEQSKRYIENSMLFVMFMGSAFTFGLAGIAPVLAPVFFGKQYYACIELITYLSITILFISWANVIRTQYLIPNNMDRSYIISVSLGAVVNLIINLCLIPQFAAVGAVVGTIFAEGSVCICQTIMVRKRLPITKYLKTGIPFIIIGGLMCIVLRIIGNVLTLSVFTLVVEIVLGAIFYIVISFAYLFIIRHPVLKQIMEILQGIVAKLKGRRP